MQSLSPSVASTEPSNSPTPADLPKSAGVLNSATSPFRLRPNPVQYLSHEVALPCPLGASGLCDHNQPIDPTELALHLQSPATLAHHLSQLAMQGERHSILIQSLSTQLARRDEQCKEMAAEVAALNDAVMELSDQLEQTTAQLHNLRNNAPSHIKPHGARIVYSREQLLKFRSLHVKRPPGLPAIAGIYASSCGIGPPPKPDQQPKRGASKPTPATFSSAPSHSKLRHTPEPTDEKSRLMSITRAVTAALNKLTPENFDKVSTQLLSFIVDQVKDVDGITAAVQVLIDKALAETKFAAVYAKLCTIINKAKPTFRATQAPPGAPAELSFLRVLLSSVQREFERGLSPLAQVSADPDILDLARQKQKKRMLGNISFIGELFQVDLLNVAIIRACFEHLLRAASSHNGESHATGDPAEEVEALCKLTALVGAKMEANAKDVLDGYFVWIDQVLSSGKLPARLRFLLKNVVELRQNRWRPRRAEEMPQTLDEIRNGR